MKTFYTAKPRGQPFLFFILFFQHEMTHFSSNHSNLTYNFMPKSLFQKPRHIEVNYQQKQNNQEDTKRHR